MAPFVSCSFYVNMDDMIGLMSDGTNLDLARIGLGQGTEVPVRIM
jgi:hypothetical protein